MKIALYIEDGTEQIILTPEGDVEKSILRRVSEGTRRLRIYRGGFYHCQGGWMRWSHPNGSPIADNDDDSTIIVLNRGPEESR